MPRPKLFLRAFIRKAHDRGDVIDAGPVRTYDLEPDLVV
jgi:hypothetical protein